ncbi:MAG: CHAT domain-containing protein [Bacteroidota bacterium]|nr:CHAT domain-containing protein [Bacteroidota bacterium]
MKRLASYFPLFLLLILIGCGDQSNTTLTEKADHMMRQATNEIVNNNTIEAERLLTESLALYASANNKTKLSENYAALAKLQLSAGKLQPALQNFSSARDLYAQIADRQSELPMMIAMGKIYFELGKFSEAFAILDEALFSSQLFRFSRWNADIALELGTMHAKLQRHQKAANYFTQAIPLYMQEGDTGKSIQAVIGKMGSLTVMGKKFEAYDNFTFIQQLLDHNLHTVDKPLAYAQCGLIFGQAQEWSLAKSLFERSNSLLQSASGAIKNTSEVYVHCGFGELYFNNFSYGQAQQEFIAAYNAAKVHSENIIEAYLLIRIADCEIKKSPSRPSSDEFIRAVQFYEHAQTLFSRAGLSIGEAIVLHRLGMVKESLHDDNAAITYYKRAFDKFHENSIDPALLSLPIDIQTLYSTPTQRYTLEQWFTEHLISLLLKLRRFDEALTFVEITRSLALQQSLDLHALHFRDPEKQKSFSEFIAARFKSEEIQRALSAALQGRDREYTMQLQQQRTQAVSVFNTLSLSFMQKYKQFAFLNTSQRSALVSFDYLPSSYTLLDYCFVNDEAWVFVLRQGKETIGIKLTSFGDELSKKMNRCIEMLSSSAPNTRALYQLSEELYELLMQPVEKFGTQRFVIIPPLGFEKFPFHMLTKNEKPLLEMIEVSYIPAVAFGNINTPFPQYINNIVAFGYTADTRWGLEFELRDIRSFFRNAQIFANENATEENLKNALGEVLQISSTFRTTQDKEYFFTLTDGSASTGGTTIPISLFASLHPFPRVYLSDVQMKTNKLTPNHSVYWALNGTSSIITTELPIEPRSSRIFGENFYSTLSSTSNPFNAYRQAVLQLHKQSGIAERQTWASYFFYGL